MITLPEDMNKVSENPQEALRTLEAYIRYMTERINYAGSFAATLQKLADMGAELRVADGKVMLALEGELADQAALLRSEIALARDGLHLEITEATDGIRGDLDDYKNLIGTRFDFGVAGLGIRGTEESSDSLFLAPGEVDINADGTTQMTLSKDGINAEGEITAKRGLRVTDGYFPYVFRVLDGKLTLLRG